MNHYLHGLAHGNKRGALLGFGSRGYGYGWMDGWMGTGGNYNGDFGEVVTRGIPQWRKGWWWPGLWSGFRVWKHLRGRFFLVLVWLRLSFFFLFFLCLTRCIRPNVLPCWE